MSTDVLVPYAAGFFDGEGWVGVVTQVRQGYNPIQSLLLNIAQVDVRPLETLRERWGGYLSLDKTTGCWRLIMSAGPAIRFLTDIRPYLVVKAELVDLAFEFQATKVITGKAMTEEAIQQRNNIVSRIRNLNRPRKGLVGATT